MKTTAQVNRIQVDLLGGKSLAIGLSGSRGESKISRGLNYGRGFPYNKMEAGSGDVASPFFLIGNNQFRILVDTALKIPTGGKGGETPSYATGGCRLLVVPRGRGGVEGGN